MNSNFIEEENTVYEIDPDCKIVNLKKEENHSRYKRACVEANRKKAVSLESLILLWLLIRQNQVFVSRDCQGPHKKKDRKPSHSHCR